MLDLVDLSEWKTKATILRELADLDVIVDEREFRRVVELHNRRFLEGETDVFIAHSVKGYKLTSNAKEIYDSIDDYKKRALNQLWKVSKYSKALGLLNNLRLEIEGVMEQENYGEMDKNTNRYFR